MEQLKCECCGGSSFTVSTGKYKCDYCGAEYKHRDPLDVVRIQTVPPRTERFRAEVMLDNFEIREVGYELASAKAMSILTDKLAEAIPYCMRVNVQEDIMGYRTRFMADMRVIMPDSSVKEYL